MQTIQLKQEVQRAIRSEWPAFAQSHPHLAAVLDETLLVESAVASLVDDAEYQEAMATALAAGVAAQVISDVVQRLVNRWLRSLLG